MTSHLAGSLGQSDTDTKALTAAAKGRIAPTGPLSNTPTFEITSTSTTGPTLPSKRSTDTFGNQDSERDSSVIPLMPEPANGIHNASQSSTAPRMQSTTEDFSDSDDEAPYSDSEIDYSPRENGQITPTTTYDSSSNGKKTPYNITDERNTPPGSFPKPPTRQGVHVITHSDPPTQTSSRYSDTKHSAGGLSHQRSTTLIHRRNAANQDTKTPPDLDNRTRVVDEGESLSLSGSSAYRSAGARSNLSEWAPSAQPPSGPWAGISNLPDWTTLRRGEPTSKPIVNIQRDLDWSMRRLINESVFEQLVNDQLGRHRFREFLAQTTGTENKLDMYFDLVQYAKQNEAMRRASEALHDVYLAQDSESHVAIPDDMSDDFYDLLKKQFQVRLTFEPLQQHLLQSLYQSDFKLFVKSRLVEHNKVKLGSFNDDSDQSGLGDCFCLTNPRLRENPIVLVSPGFEKVTGYPRQQIIGRNCRFLQGPGTAPDSVQRVRNGLNAGEPCTELLLNYRRDGSPFFCLLTIIPLRDATGTLVYFIGGQTNVNGQLASSKGLQFLLGGVAEQNGSQQPPTMNGLEVSPCLARYIQRGALQNDPLNSSNDGQAGVGIAMTKSSSVGSSSNLNTSISKRGLAAGAYDPVSQAGPNTPITSSAISSSSNTKTSGKVGGSAMSRLFGRKDQQQQRVKPDVIQPSQRLIGAESTMRKDPYSLEDQMQYFTALYSKVIIFKRTKREIIFATRDVISFFDLPLDNWKDVYSSPLIHSDLLSIIQGADKDETRMVQQAIQVAVRKGESISVKTGIKQVKMKKRFLGVKSSTPDWVSMEENNFKYTTIHITPLLDRDNSSFAFVALFG